MEPSLSVRRFYWEVIDAWNEVNDYDPPGSFTIVSQAGFCLTDNVSACALTWDCLKFLSIFLIGKHSK